MSLTGQLFANCEMAPKLCMEFFFLEFWQTSENEAAHFLLGKDDSSFKHYHIANGTNYWLASFTGLPMHAALWLHNACKVLWTKILEETRNEATQLL